MVPLVATTAEEEFKKTVHRNDILHAKQLVRDIAFDDDNIDPGIMNASENAVGNCVPLDTEASSSDEDDVVEAVIPSRHSRGPVAVPHESPSVVDVQVTHGDGNHTQNQVEVLEEAAPDWDHGDEPPVIVIMLLLKVVPPQFKPILSFPPMALILTFLLMV